MGRFGAKQTYNDSVVTTEYSHDYGLVLKSQSVGGDNFFIFHGVSLTDK